MLAAIACLAGCHGSPVPILVLREDFREVPAHIPVTADDLSCAFLGLERLGPGADELKLSFHPTVENDPHYVWNGECDGPALIAFPFAHPLDLSAADSLARVRTKNSGHSTIRLAVRVADRWFVQDSALAADPDWTLHTLHLHGSRWLTLDPQTVLAADAREPDLGAVEALGFACPGPPRGSADCVRLDWFELVSSSAQR